MTALKKLTVSFNELTRLDEIGHMVRSRDLSPSTVMVSISVRGRGDSWWCKITWLLFWITKAFLLHYGTFVHLYVWRMRMFSAQASLFCNQSRSQSFVPLDQRSENESSGSNHYERTKEITEFWLFGSLRIYIYCACLKWLLPELSFSDRWSRGTKLWERDCSVAYYCYFVVTWKICEMLSCLLICDRFSWSFLMSVLTKSLHWMGSRFVISSM